MASFTCLAMCFGYQLGSPPCHLSSFRGLCQAFSQHGDLKVSRGLEFHDLLTPIGFRIHTVHIDHILSVKASYKTNPYSHGQKKQTLLLGESRNVTLQKVWAQRNVIHQDHYYNNLLQKHHLHPTTAQDPSQMLLLISGLSYLSPQLLYHLFNQFFALYCFWFLCSCLDPKSTATFLL